MGSISIVIPVYNVEKYIERCLLSVMEQKNYEGYIECILVDDCTPDQSIAIARELIDAYQGPICFRIIHNPENQGLSCSRNNGLMSAHGDYVFFLDSDDYLSNDCLHCLSLELGKHNCVVDMVIGNSYDKKHEKYWQDPDRTTSLLQDHVDIMRRFLEFEIPMMAWNKLIRRQFLLDNHLLFAPHMLHEDELWSYNVFDIVSSVVLIPDVTYQYEQNTNSIMTSSQNLHHRVEAHHVLINNMLATLNQNDLYVERFFWGIHMYMFSIDFVFQYDLSSELRKKNRIIRRRLLKKAIDDGRLFIAVFLLLTVFPPFIQLVRLGWFRHKYHIITSSFKSMALKCDLFHSSSTNCS